MSGYRPSHVVRNIDVAKEVARIKKECGEVGITPTELCRSIGVKAGLVTSWGWRAGQDPNFRPRGSVFEAMNEELKRLRRQKDEEALAQMRQNKDVVPKHLQNPGPKIEVIETKPPAGTYDDPDLRGATYLRPLNACDALTSIIKEKIKGMTLVQLAMLLSHIEGNGK